MNLETLNLILGPIGPRKNLLFKWVVPLMPRYVNCKEYYKQDPADMITILKYIL